jgi:hypothetical protein
MEAEEIILVFSVMLNGAELIDTNPKNIAGWIETDLQDMEEGDEEYTVVVSKKWMSKQEFENLPTFEGY